MHASMALLSGQKPMRHERNSRSREHAIEQSPYLATAVDQAVVDERITDGERIAELLVAELRGRQGGSLGPVTTTTDRTDDETVHTICTVTEPVAPRREPDPAILKRPIARFRVVDDHIELTPLVNEHRMIAAAKAGELPVEGAIIVDHAAVVKRVIDVLAAGITD